MGFIKKYAKRIKIVVLGLVLFCVPYIIFGEWGEEPYNPFDYPEVYTGGRYEYYCNLNGGIAITSSEYGDIKAVLGQRMAYAPIDNIYVHYSGTEDDSTAVFVVDCESDMFLDYKVMFNILTCKGEVIFATKSDDGNLRIWLSNEDLAAAMDNTSYRPTTGNEYGVLLRVDEKSLEKFDAMVKYAADNNEEIYVYIDGKSIKYPAIYSGSGDPASKGMEYGNILVITESMEENTRLLMVGTSDVMETSIEVLRY